MSLPTRLLIIFLLLWNGSHARESNSTLVIGLMIPFTQEWALGQQAASAIIPAIRRVEELGLLPGYQIEWLMRDTGCNMFTGFRALVDIWRVDHEVDVLIGPACSVVCQYVGLLAAVWNIPTISYFCTSSTLSDKNTYPTFVRTTNVVQMTAPIAAAALDVFSWTRCTIVRTPQEVWSVGAHEALLLLQANDKKVYNHIVQPTVTADVVDEVAMADQIHVIDMIKHESRFIFLYMYWEDVRIFLLNAKTQGLLNGEYIFYSHYTADMLEFDSEFQSETSNDDLFTGVLILEAVKPKTREWHELTEDMLEAFADPRFDGYDTVRTTDAVSHHAGYLYDAVLLWAHALNRTLEAGESMHDGTAIVHKVFNFTFEGITGNVTIDAKGDRKIDNNIFIVQPGGRLVELFHWHAMEGYLEKTYNPESTDDFQGIVWPGGSIITPDGIPRCGWDGEHCPSIDEAHHVSAVLFSVGAVIFLLVFVALNFYRRYLNRAAREEIEKCILHAYDISILDKNVSSGRGEGLVLRRAILPPGTICKCKVHDIRAHISVHRINRDLPHRAQNKLRKEIKRIRSLSHDNLNPFIGIHFTDTAIGLVHEYASRGHLQDMIMNHEGDLGWDFKISFIADITRGLSYIHQGILGFHGHLTSKDCVVDKRWVCKISNYGFSGFRQGRQLSVINSNFWTAPEVLRGRSRGDSVADVYSFGIIIQEILTDSLPYGSSQLAEAQIIGMVRDGQIPETRPYIDPAMVPQDWINIVQFCWQEDPTLRPTCDEILNMIMKINNGTIPNLVDTMIDNLEKHTSKLEELVTEKTEELSREQAMIDILLSELLPESVATRMKLGKPIEPESFDSVTLFFSDIVGFTRVSAKSTPLEVVTMLNALYSRFDEILSRYDVYKFATIGDAYMVGSGVPRRNDQKHASEIARMSLKMLNVIDEFTIPHISDEKLFMRIGLHTGPCVAAVTGIKAPRYLLFGDTIDIAARMEAGGAPMKIHISDVTAILLRAIGGFLIESRGRMTIKGVGSIETFWLTGVSDISKIDLVSDSAMTLSS